MKILHTADWHLGAKLADFDRLEEQQAVMQEIISIAKTQAVDLVLIAGDLFDTYNPSSRAEDLFYATLSALAEGGKRAVVAIAGNHDSPDKIAAPIPLAKNIGICLLGHPNKQADSIAVPSTGLKTSKVANGFLELQLPNVDYPVRIITTPYANESRLGKHWGLEDQANKTSLSETLAQHWSDLASEHCDTNGVNLLVAHQFIVKRGGQVYSESESERSILHVGGSESIFTDAFPVQIQYVALGHLHNRITVQEDPMPVIYSSSPLSYSLSEAGQTKYVTIIDVEPNQKATFEFLPLRAGKQLHRKTFNSAADAVVWLTENQDCLVEVSIKTKTSLSSAEVAQIKKAHQGIIGQPIPILTDEAVTESDSTSIEDISTKTIQEHFQDYFKSIHKIDANPELLSLFQELLAQDDSGE